MLGKMSCNVYYEHNKVSSLQHHVLKVFDCANKNCILLLTLKNELIIKYEDKNDLVLREGIVDASYSYPLFYIVDIEGKVYKTSIEQIKENRWDEIEVDGKICEISANGDGVLMINQERDLLGMGNFENVLKSDEPKKIECFCKYSCLQMATGDNFAIVLVRQRGLEGTKENETNVIENTKHKGKEVLKTQVWSFGSINKSDTTRKDEAVSISLVDVGVYKISCGNHHAAALTYDGRLFLWGLNKHQQIIDSSSPEFLTPLEFKSEINGKLSKNVLAAACGATNTVILLNDLTFRILGKNGNGQDQNEEFASDLKYEHDAGNVENNEAIKSVPYIISHNKVLLVNRKNLPMFLLTFLTEEQRNTRILINVHQKYIKVLQTVDDDSWTLAKSYENILYIAVANLRIAFDFLLSDCEQKLEQVIVNSQFDETMKEFYHYLKNLCDILSFYSLSHYEKRMELKIVKIVVEKPFASLEIYDKLLDLIYDLHLYNNPNLLTHDHEIEELKRLTVERKKTIDDFRKIVIPQKIKEASDTFAFWQSLADAHIKAELHHKERRFVMDSNQTQLKLHERTNLFGSNRFILFNDYLVCVLARIEFIPIHLVWLQSFSTPSPNKFSFKIITPESMIKVFALTPQDKNDWQKNIRDCTRHALRINPTVVNQALPVSRYGSYKFSDRNAKYPSYEVEGKWFEGRFYELCHIKIPGINRQFKCRVSVAGEVTGNGMIEDILFSYHGEFVQGKLQGYGTWKSKLKPIHYQGFFKNDKFHGHGVMSNDENIFFGEFVNGVKNGFGIEDDASSGNKYIGIWQDGKRHGPGILITMDGSYFEGIFINNNLCGDGLAIFPNGSYYIGELSVDGASGVGTLYLPDAEIIEEIMELDDSNMKMKGNILKGLLAGSWDKIAIMNGSLLMNEIFLKTPNSINYLKIKSDRKWVSLFENWLEEVFGTLLPEKLGLHDRWHRMSAYIQRKKNFECDMRRNFMLINEENTSKDDFNEISYCLPFEQQPQSLPSISRSNSELYLKDATSVDFETASLRTFSDYSISSLANGVKKSERDIDFVPPFHQSTFNTSEAVDELRAYLESSIEDMDHPFFILINEVRRAFCTSYGSWRSKPTSILSKIAMSEWISLMKRIYNIFRLLFPSLPSIESSNMDSDDENEGDCQLLAPLNFMHKLLLNDEIYSCFFLLYASKNSRQDELYSQRLITCEKKSNEDLRQLLKIEPDLVPLLEDDQFLDAIKIFQKLSQKYCPSEMLEVIKDTYELISVCAKKIAPRGDLLSADNLLSITIYLIIKAGINHLGAEMSLLTDLMENDIEKLINMEQYIYTTVKIGYLHTISARFFHT